MSRQPFSDFFEDELNALVQAELQQAWRDVPPRNSALVARQRAAFIAAGVRLAEQAKWLQLKLLSRTAFRYAAIVLFTLLSTFIGARVVSAQSLPGDRLYPVKLSLESVDGLFYGGEAWEAQQEARRLQEVLDMVARGESTLVNFVATPFQTDDGQWYVGAVRLVVTSEQNRMLRNQCTSANTRVIVMGQISDGKIFARGLTPSCFYVASR